MYEEFREIYRAFQEYGSEDPLRETLHLVDIISGGVLRAMGRACVKSFLEQQGVSLAHVAQERRKGIPLEYIIGMATFAGLSLHCSKGTLVPTDWTKQLVDVALDTLQRRQETRRSQTLVEIGTGCANIAVSLALRTEGVEILASDISPEAVEVAQKNIDECGLANRITLFCGDLHSPFLGSEYEGAVDVVVCNPPYIPTGSLSDLPSETTEHEPLIALDGGPYGIDFYRRLITDSVAVLRPGGALIFEVCIGKETLVTSLLERNGRYGDTRHHQNTDGEAGVISAFKTG